MQNLCIVTNEYLIARQRVDRVTQQVKYRKFLAKGTLAFKCEEVKLLQHIRGAHDTRTLSPTTSYNIETPARVFSKRTFGHKCEMLACRWVEGSA